MDILFMGTPDFAAGVLEAIHESGKHNITCVVTQPDRPQGRSGKMVASAVKELAVSYGIPVLQPEKIKTPEEVEKLKDYKADICVVAAFGQILSEEILNMFPKGCINVHASLLPQYRGAAPIQWAIADGLKETGVTIMQMDKGLDTGDIITQCTVKISEEDTGESLFDKLKDAGSSLLVDTLSRIEAGNVTKVPQDETKATYAKILKKEMGRIDFDMDAGTISNRMRAFTPWPGAYTFLDGKMLKIKGAGAVNESDMSDAAFKEAYEKAAAARIFYVTKNEFYVRCHEGALKVTVVQPEGKKQMSVHDYLLGKKIEAGSYLG